MRGGLVLVCLGSVGLVGCFAPTPQPGAACAPGDLCPEGLVCDNGICVVTPSGADGRTVDACGAACTTPDGAPDAMIALLDTDNDTIPDVVDNCVLIPNPSQHDEDADTVGDACDNCPHLAAAQTDGDNDGVGDACDPSPAVGGDFIARFISFEGGVIPADLTLTGTWTGVNNDAARTSSTNARMLIPGSRMIVTAEMGGDVESVSGTSRELKIVTARTATSQWHSCGFDDTDSTMLYTFEIENENGGGGTTIILNAPEPTRPTRIDPGAFYIRNTADTTALTVTCAGMEGASPIATSAAAPALTAGQVEVISTRVSYSLRYIIIIGHT